MCFFQQHVTGAPFLPFIFHSSMYDQLSHPDCDSRTSSQGEDLYLQEADAVPELDWSAHQRYQLG